MTADAGRERTGRHRAAVVAWTAAAVSLAAFAGAWILAAGRRDLLDVSADFGPDRFLFAYPVVGTVLVARRPSNRIGWLLLSVGVIAAARALAGEYALNALTGPARPATAVWAEWFIGWSLILIFPTGALAFLLLLFPGGRPLSARWAVIGWLAAGYAVIFLVLTWLDPGSLSVTGLPAVANPTGVRGWLHTGRDDLADIAAWLAGFLILLLAAVSLLVRYRRSAGDERLQLKWFVFAVVVSVAVLAALVPVANGATPGHAAFALAVVAGIGLALPVGIGVAVLKYRLYAIDRIISRTVSYVLVTGLVVGVYLSCIALLTKPLPVRGNVGVAVSVLAAAAMFNPLRRRVQGAVDRRFNRARYDAERVVTQFSEQLRDEVDLDVLAAGLTGVVDQVLAPEHIGLWLNARD
jgi:hypothetical protein